VKSIDIGYPPAMDVMWRVYVIANPARHVQVSAQTAYFARQKGAVLLGEEPGAVEVELI
jgi:hypothetical protein